MIINHLTTDKEFNLGNLGAPLSRAVGLRRRTIVGHEIHVTQKITLAFETDCGHAPIGDIPLDHLAFNSLGKVCVSLVRGAKKADFGLTDEVYILSTDSNELGDTTRHFIV